MINDQINTWKKIIKQVSCSASVVNKQLLLESCGRII